MVGCMLLQVGGSYRPAMDHQEGFGGAIEGASSEGLWFAWDDVAQVILRLRWLAERESGNGPVTFILMVKQVFKRVQEVT